MLDVPAIRTGFPALTREVDGRPAAYLDGPGGTQVHRSVIEAMDGFMRRGGSNHHGAFITSQETDQLVEDARAAVADLYGADPHEIVFGQNMTSLTYALSRALGRTWRPGDNIIVTRLDHDANVAPWAQAAADAGVEVRFVDFDPDGGCALDLGTLDASLDNRTRLVAFTHASNAVGTITPVLEIVAAAHSVGALTYVDAVHYAPHGLIDVRQSGTDFLVSSAYKWFGPHTGCLYGRSELLEGIEPYKLRPAPDTAPDRWETGTQSFESIAGVLAAVDYLASLGRGGDRRSRLADAYRRIIEHEQSLSDRFLARLAEMPDVRLAGRRGSDGRTPTFAIEVDGFDPRSLSAALGQLGIFVWSGDYYAFEVMRRLDRAEHGMVRIGFVHYNTADEVDRVLDAIERFAR
ncbi:MAG: cysteine desulfurase-like protein [Acidimicrobiia bacterium]|nr:cysteine desulfurase-like protein [Acidimicrobiia bacterium]